jgi:hypothetical protein
MVESRGWDAVLPPPALRGAISAMAAVLFLAGISTVFRSERTRMWLLGGSAVVLAGSAIYLVTLPNAVGV